jgi:hypothetical protein
MLLHLIVARKPACNKDLERYAEGSTVTGRAFNGGQVKG